MFPRACPVTGSRTAKGSEPPETAENREKKTQENGKKKTGKKKKGGRTLPAVKTSHHRSHSTLQSTVVSQDGNTADQQIAAARLHKIKELKNEIFDVQRKIEAASLENHTLRHLQLRQSRAIDRYKNSEGNFQDILARHYDEVRDLKDLLRMSQESERNTAKKVRKAEAEMLKAKDTLETLLVLSEEKGLAGREELNDRLSVLTQKLEAKDERIQSLEMQLKLNNNIHSRQLASKSKKILEAGIVTKNLKMEINALHQKIKEIDRQLYIKNIYANRMPKALKDSSDSAPQEQGLSVNRAVQVDKECFRARLLSQHQGTEKSPTQLIKEKKDGEAAANGANSAAQSRRENQPAKKILMPETSNRAHREYIREGRLLMEHSFSAFMKEKGKERELLKKELKNLMKTEQSDGVKDNSQERDAVEEFEKEEEPEAQQTNSEKGRSEGATPNKTPAGVKKKNTSPGTIENLHQELLPSKSRAGSQSQAGQGCSGTVASPGKNSFGLYKPRFGQDTKPGQEDGSAGAEGCAHVAHAGRKERLMEELFGAGAAQRDNPSSSNTTGAKAEK